MLPGGGRRKRGLLAWIPWRGLLLLALLVTAVRVFFCTVLRVPTGSMEPTLRGDPTRGDELLVFKPYYRMFRPARFDLVVFRRSGSDVKSEERVAVKRVVALGGESVRVQGGDLFVAAPGEPERRLAKEYRDFRGLLIPLWREPFDARTPERLFSRDDSRTLHDAEGITLAGEPDDGSGVILELASDAVRFDDGWVDARNVVTPGGTAVKDVLFELELELEHDTLSFVFEFTSGGDHLSFTLTPRAANHLLSFVRESVESGTQFPTSTNCRRITTGRRHRLEFWQIDGRVGFAVDGRVEFDEPLPGGVRVVTRGTDVRGVSLSVAHGGARLTRFDVWRDLYHDDAADGQETRFGVAEPYEVPHGECFVLGDASSRSIDSRHFGSVRLDDIAGAPLLVVGPRSRWRWLR